MTNFAGVLNLTQEPLGEHEQSLGCVEPNDSDRVRLSQQLMLLDSEDSIVRNKASAKICDIVCGYGGRSSQVLLPAVFYDVLLKMLHSQGTTCYQFARSATQDGDYWLEPVSC